MSKAKFAKIGAGLLITSGVAITLPVYGPFLAPVILPLTAGILSDDLVKKLGEKGTDYFVGIIGSLVASKLEKAPELLKTNPENHDLLKLLAQAYSKAIAELLAEIENDPKYGKLAKLTLSEIKQRIDDAVGQNTQEALEGLFPSKEFLEIQKALGENPVKVPFLQKLFGFSPKEKVLVGEELAAKQSSEEFILNIADNPETSKQILTDEVEISLRRWFAETTPTAGEFPQSLTSFVFEKIAKKVPRFVGELIKDKDYEKSWVAFQRSHLQAILTEIRTNKGLSKEDKELLTPLTKKLEELIKSDFPTQLADSTAEVISHLGESEERITQCVKDETSRLRDFLEGMEDRIRGYINDAATEIIEVYRDPHRERTLPNSIPESKGFVGREDYLSNFRKCYEDGCKTFVLSGLGGVGKTALALKFANEISDEYEAKVFVDMKGMQTDLSAMDAVHEIVRQFSPETPDSDFVTLLNKQPTLIFLDNAKDEDAVKPLVKTGKACFIITSRQRMYLGEEPFDILKMSEEDAVQFLQNKGGKNRFGDYAEKIAEECGYLPQALVVIKGLLMKQRVLKLEEFLNEFKENKLKYLDEVTASLNFSYEMIGSELQKYLRSLAVFQNTFDKEACSLIWGVNVEEAEQIVAELDSYNLLESGPVFFSLHDLVLEFCDLKLSGTERITMFRNSVNYYSSILEKKKMKFEEADSLLTKVCDLHIKAQFNSESQVTWLNHKVQLSAILPLFQKLLPEKRLAAYSSLINDLITQLDTTEDVEMLVLIQAFTEEVILGDVEIRKLELEVASLQLKLASQLLEGTSLALQRAFLQFLIPCRDESFSALESGEYHKSAEICNNILYFLKENRDIAQFPEQIKAWLVLLFDTYSKTISNADPQQVIESCNDAYRGVKQHLDLLKNPGNRESLLVLLTAFTKVVIKIEDLELKASICNLAIEISQFYPANQLIDLEIECLLFDILSDTYLKLSKVYLRSENVDSESLDKARDSLENCKVFSEMAESIRLKIDNFKEKTISDLPK